MTDVVIVRDASSGRVHRRFRSEGGRLASLEECNADSSGAYSVLTDAEAAATEADDQCRHCFPRTGTYNSAADTTTITVTNVDR